MNNHHILKIPERKRSTCSQKWIPAISILLFFSAYGFIWNASLVGFRNQIPTISMELAEIFISGENKNDSDLKPQTIVTAKRSECSGFEDLPLFREKCSYFLSDLKEWRSASRERTKIVSWRTLSGTGDRLAGLVSMFYYGMTVKKKMTVKWDLLDSVFKPSCLMKEIFSISNTTESKPDKKVDCIQKSHNVARRDGDLCTSGNMHLIDKQSQIRAAASKRRCAKIDKFYGNKATLAHMIGCPLRMMLEYTDSFLDSKVSYFLDGTKHTATLRELGNELKKFKTVGLHYRAGDQEMSEGAPKLNFTAAMLDTATSCVKTVSQYLNSQNENGDTRPIKWLVASDSENVRNFYTQNFPNDVIQLLIRPSHVSKADVSEEFVRVFQEFYLLGLTDELVSNFRDERLSAYSKFARLVNLKSLIYITNFMGEKCVLKEIDFEGNTRTFPKECSANPFIGHTFHKKGSLAFEYFPPQFPLQSHKTLSNTQSRLKQEQS